MDGISSVLQNSEADKMKIDEVMQQGVAASEAGNKEAAYQIFKQLVAEHPGVLEAWVWMGWTATSPDDAAEAFTRAHALDPTNEEAAMGLRWVETQKAANGAPGEAPQPAASADTPPSPDATPLATSVLPSDPPEPEMDDEQIAALLALGSAATKAVISGTLTTSGTLTSSSLGSGSLGSGSLPTGPMASGSLSTGSMSTGSMSSGSLSTGSLTATHTPTGPIGRRLSAGSTSTGTLVATQVEAGPMSTGSLATAHMSTGPLQVADTWNFQHEMEKGIEAAQAGDRSAAYATFQQVAARQPDVPDVWVWLGGTSPTMEEAEAAFKRAYSLDPTNEEANLGLRWVALRRQQTRAGADGPERSMYVTGPLGERMLRTEAGQDTAASVAEVTPSAERQLTGFAAFIDKFGISMPVALLIIAIVVVWAAVVAWMLWPK